MVVITSVGVILASMLLCIVFYNQFTVQFKNDLKAITEIFAGNSAGAVKAELENFKQIDIRLTLIEPNGEVIFDTANPAGKTENHLNREEIGEALAQGFGESRRFSSTLGRQTYYYAIRLGDGSVLRASKTTESIWKVFSQILPLVGFIVLGVIVVGYVVSAHVTKKIVEPLNNADTNPELFTHYDELAPFVKTIVRQQEKIAHDFTELQARMDTTNAITENMNEGIIMLDKAGTVLSFNKSVGEIFNINKTFVGKNFRELSRDLELSTTLKEAVKGESGDMVFEKDGNIFRVLTSPVQETGVIIFFLDITEKSLAEKMRQEFSANVSHELKTPLTTIYGNAEMLFGDVVLEDDKKSFYKKIMDEASRLIELIEDIMMISQLDEGHDRQHFEYTKLENIANECAEALEKKAQQNQVEIKIFGSAVLFAKPSMIYEMFYNLIDNAVKYNVPGGVVEVKLTQNENGVKIIVADSGIGIPTAAQTRIFERFYRVDKSRSKKTGGTGLGLAIVKHIVQTHGGRISVSSSEGKGTQVEMIFEKI